MANPTGVPGAQGKQQFGIGIFVPAGQPVAFTSLPTFVNTDGPPQIVETWSVYDQTAAPVGLPAIQLLPFVSTDGPPLIIESWSVYDPTAAPVLPPVQVLLPFVSTDGPPLIIESWSIYDPTAAPFPVSAPAAPTFGWQDTHAIRGMQPLHPLDNLTAPIGIASGQFLPNFLPQWLGQSDVRPLPPKKPPDEIRNPVTISEIVINFVPQWHHQHDLKSLRPRTPLDNLTAPIGIASGQFLANLLPQWLGQSDVIRLPPLKPLDNLTAPIGIAAGQFLANFLSQWLGQSDIRKLPPLRPLDNLTAPISVAAGQFLANFLSQWLGQSDVAKLLPPRQLDNLLWNIIVSAATQTTTDFGWQTVGELRHLPNPRQLDTPLVIAPAAGQFLANFLAQWIGQTDIARLPPLKPLDNLTAPIGAAAGQFIANFVTQWLGQTDVTRLPSPRQLDNLFAAIGQGAVANFVSQWLGQSDIGRLPLPRPLDNLTAPLGFAAGQFLVNFVAEWMGTDLNPVNLALRKQLLQEIAHLLQQQAAATQVTTDFGWQDTALNTIAPRIRPSLLLVNSDSAMSPLFFPNAPVTITELHCLPIQAMVGQLRSF